MRHIFVAPDGCASAIVAKYPHSVQRQYLGYGNIVKGWDGFQLGKGQRKYIVLRRGGGRPAWSRRGPGIERLETVRGQLCGTTDYCTSFEPSTCRLLMR